MSAQRTRKPFEKFKKKYLTQGRVFLYAIVLFMIGLVIILLPVSSDDVSVLPETGSISKLVTTVTGSKTDIQLDDPTEGARVIDYTIDVTNETECVKEPVDIVLVVDASGSMETYSETVNHIAEVLASYMDSDADLLSLVVFNESASVENSLTRSFGSVVKEINEMSFSGSSNLGKAIQVAHQELTQNSTNKQQAIVVLSDGRSDLPTNGPEEYALNQSEAAIEDGVKLVTIALGEVANVEFLASLSSTGSDTAFISPSDNDLIALYAGLMSGDTGYSYGTKVIAQLMSDNLSVSNISRGGKLQHNLVMWDVGVLQCQESQTVSFTGTVGDDAIDLEIIEVVVDVTNGLGDVAGRQSSITTIHAPVLAITNTNNVDYALPGDDLTYHVGVQNVGSGNAYGVVFKDRLSEMFELNEQSLFGGVVDGNMIMWGNDGAGYNLSGSFVPIGNVTSREFSFSGEISNAVLQGQFDLSNTFIAETTNGLRVRDEIITPIPNLPDLAIFSATTPAEGISPGDTLDVVLTVQNNGVVPAEDVTVVERFDESALRLLNSETGAHTYGTLTWDIDVLQPNESKELTYQVVVNEFVTTEELTMMSEVTSPTGDISEVDNIYEGTVSIVTTPLVKGILSSTRVAFVPGAEMLYTVTLQNVSSFPAVNVKAKIVYPDAFVFVSQVSSEGVTSKISDTSIDLEIGTLAPKDVVSYSYVLGTSSSIVPDNYSSELNASWTDEFGNPFTIDPYQSIVSIIDEEEYSGDDITIVADSGSAIDQFVDSANRFFELPQTGDTTQSLKLVLGALLLLPFPIVFIYDVVRSLQKQRSK